MKRRFKMKKVTKKKISKASVEFEEKCKLVELKDKHNVKQHERRMEELKYLRDSEKLHHNNEMERQRIKSAEIQRTISRKEQARKSYSYQPR